MMRTLRWILLVLLLLGIGGGGYYVLAVAWPARYARAVLAFEREFKQGPPAFQGVSTDVSRLDADAARALLEVQRTHVTSFTEKVRALRPAPPAYRQFQGDLEAGLQGLLDLADERARLLDFTVGLRELQSLVRAGLPTAAQPLTVSQALGHIDRELPGLRAFGDRLFAQDIPSAPQVAELKIAWMEAQQGLDVLLATLRTRNPSELFQSTVAALDTPATRAAEEKVERFNRLLEDAVSRSSVSVVLTSSVLSSPPPDLALRLQRVQETFEKLREQYGDNAR